MQFDARVDAFVPRIESIPDFFGGGGDGERERERKRGGGEKRGEKSDSGNQPDRVPMADRCR